MYQSNVKDILYNKTSEEIEIINLTKNEDIDKNKIDLKIKEILACERNDNRWIIKGEEFIDSNRNIMLSKHHRFIDIPIHSHDFIEFSYVYSGSMTQIIDGEKITLEEGDSIILDTNVQHSIDMVGENDIIINILMKKEYFDTSLFSRLSSNDIICDFLIKAVYESKKFNSYCVFTSNGNFKIKSLIESFILEYYKESICLREILDCYMILIFAELLEVYKNQVEVTSFIHERNTTNSIAEVLKYIQQNYLDVTLSSVAKKFHFHPNYLSNNIKKITGKSFKEIVHMQRLKQAELFLKNTDLSIDEIFRKIGYTNQSFFYKKFKEHYGLTPKEYRKNIT